MAAHADSNAPPSTIASDIAPAPQTAGPPPAVNGLQAFFDDWAAWAGAAKASQPSWASPIATTSALLGQRFRFEVQQQQAGNGTDTTELDNGKGLDLIVSDTQEIRIALPPYTIRTGSPSQTGLTGFGDWQLFRFKQRLFSSPQDQGNYVVSAWLRIGLPTGVARLTNHAVTLSPTLGFGKGWGPFVIQGNLGGVIPTAYEGKLGERIVSNMAFQYRVWGMLWPEMEVNWTYYPNGPRGGLSRVYLTPGISIARIPLTRDFSLTLAIGYQSAVAPSYRAKPLTPPFNNAWLFSSSIGF